MIPEVNQWGWYSGIRCQVVVYPRKVRFTPHPWFTPSIIRRSPCDRATMRNDTYLSRSIFHEIRLDNTLIYIMHAEIFFKRASRNTNGQPASHTSCMHGTNRNHVDIEWMETCLPQRHVPHRHIERRRDIAINRLTKGHSKRLTRAGDQQAID